MKEILIVFCFAGVIFTGIAFSLVDLYFTIKKDNN